MNETFYIFTSLCQWHAAAPVYDVCIFCSSWQLLGRAAYTILVTLFSAVWWVECVMWRACDKLTVSHMSAAHSLSAHCSVHRWAWTRTTTVTDLFASKFALCVMACTQMWLLLLLLLVPGMVDKRCQLKPAMAMFSVLRYMINVTVTKLVIR